MSIIDNGKMFILLVPCFSNSSNEYQCVYRLLIKFFPLNIEGSTFYSLTLEDLHYSFAFFYFLRFMFLSTYFPDLTFFTKEKVLKEIRINRLTPRVFLLLFVHSLNIRMVLVSTEDGLRMVCDPSS